MLNALCTRSWSYNHFINMTDLNRPIIIICYFTASRTASELNNTLFLPKTKAISPMINPKSNFNVVPLQIRVFTVV